jgi:hypothetical protein
MWGWPATHKGSTVGNRPPLSSTFLYFLIKGLKENKNEDGFFFKKIKIKIVFSLKNICSYNFLEEYFFSFSFFFFLLGNSYSILAAAKLGIDFNRGDIKKKKKKIYVCIYCSAPTFYQLVE